MKISIGSLLMTVLVFTIFLSSLLNVFVYPFEGKRKSGTYRQPQTQQLLKIYQPYTLSTSFRSRKVLPETVLPICNGNLLNHKVFHYEKEANGFFDTRRLMSTAGACRLRQYVAGDAVTCFDGISSDRKRLPQKNMLAPSMIDNRHEELHFVFMGDSRIRQQFFNFIQLIPDYDKKSFPRRIPTLHPKIDMEVTSNILGVRVSFKWRPLLNNNVTETIRHWATGPLERPYFILLSMTAWHMLRKHGADYQLYQEKLIKLSPLLGQLANVSHVIWLHQYPTIDFFAHNGEDSTDVFSEKIHAYNKITRQILESGQSRMRIWDSSNPLAEEYVRDCAIFKRFTENPKTDGNSDYFNCDDYIHTGNAALSQATQLLFNDICNSQMEY